MRKSLCLISMLVVFTSTAFAQTATDEIAAGDRAYAALDETAALDHYQKAAAADPRNYEALWKASRSAIDLGIPAAGAARGNALFTTAEQYGRRAVAVNPGDAEGHFVLAWALGKTALTKSASQRVKYGTDVHTHAMECLRIKPGHAGCLHVMGVWNAEIMRLNSFTRLIAKSILGGRVFGEASWKEAARYMEAAVAAEPQRVVHRLDLGEVYRDMGQKDKAREQFETGLRLPSTDFNDPRFKADIKADLNRL
jgi:tetratricopeptide (TPR) repeat protein